MSMWHCEKCLGTPGFGVGCVCPRNAHAPTMDDAIAAGDGTLHGAIDHWQTRALEAERKLAALAAQPAASAEPSDAVVRDATGETWLGMRVTGWTWVDDMPDPPYAGGKIRRFATHWSTGPQHAERLYRGSDIRALLSRYGRPAGDAQPVAWTTPDSREPISDAVKRARPDLYSKSYTVPLTVAAPVAAQSAMRTDRQRLRDLIDVVWNEATESTAVPDKPWADRMIDKVFGTASAQPAASAEPVTHHGDGPNNDEFFNQIARQGKKE